MSLMEMHVRANWRINSIVALRGDFIDRVLDVDDRIVVEPFVIGRDFNNYISITWIVYGLLL